ncbi:MAG: hypothetical protein JO104_11030 [Candidatus Eremiobacteraeota bacterium]|nr:hypothetical protein [Candidatus Eremiobacteraeota bacterium]
MKRSALLRLQGAYYCITGVSPLLSMRFFEAVTGKKTDRWLVQMVGLLASSIGLSLFVGSRARRSESSAVALSIAAAISFASIDVVHSFRRRISPIYLADAAIEVLLCAAILASRD